MLKSALVNRMANFGSCSWYVVNRHDLYTVVLTCLPAGIGGGGIVSAVWVITSEIVEVRKRAQWSQALSVTWSCSAIAGPLLGGLFSGSTC